MDEINHGKQVYAILDSTINIPKFLGVEKRVVCFCPMCTRHRRAHAEAQAKHFKENPAYG